MGQKNIQSVFWHQDDGHGDERARGLQDGKLYVVGVEKKYWHCPLSLATKLETVTKLLWADLIGVLKLYFSQRFAQFVVDSRVPPCLCCQPDTCCHEIRTFVLKDCSTAVVHCFLCPSLPKALQRFTRGLTKPSPQFVRWWVKRSRGQAADELVSGEDVSDTAAVLRLTERAKRARKRVGTDIHTASWRGDLELVKVCLG